jgi:fatty-acid peroxygenase
MVNLFDEAQKIMFIAACQWAGVPIKSEDIEKRSKEFGARVDSFGSVGPSNLKGKFARKSSEWWIRGMISQVRGGWLSTVPGSPMYTISFYKEAGKLLDIQVATVELINILRPVVAIANYVVFAAMSMHQNPATQRRIISGNKNYVDWFVQEVRRFYPFTPFVGAKVRDTFTWKGYHFPKGSLVLLDVYGTDHDPRKWEKPEEFRPERFRNYTPGPFDFIPEGGGDYYTNHRCPGEWITIEATKAAVKFLATCMEYDVPDQDLSIDLSRMPAFPKSRFIITNVKVKKPVYWVMMNSAYEF